MSFSVIGIAVAGLVLMIALYNICIGIVMARAFVRTERNPVTGIIRGAEPVYYEGKKQTACLLIHGFIGSPTDFGRLPKLLHEAGYTVSAPLLPGHGTNPRDFANVTSSDLIQTVRREYQNLKARHKKVVLIGLSMGAALAIITAAEIPVDALVLLAPYLKIRHFWYYLFPAQWYHRVFSPFIPYVYRLSCFKQVFKKDSISKMIDYSYISMRGVDTTFAIGKQALKAVSAVNIPVLVIHSKKDQATDYETSRRIFDEVKGGPVRFVSLERSNHLVLWDYDARTVENEILDFVSGHTG